MKQRQPGWLAVVIGSVMLLAVSATAPRPGAQASELAVGSILAPAAPVLAGNNAAAAVLAHTTDITFTPAYTAYLPSMSNQLVVPPAGIYGQMTYQGVPFGGVEIQLLLWNYYGGVTFH